MRRWSTKALVIALLLCATSPSISLVTRTTYAMAVGRATQFDADRQAEAERMRVAIRRTYGPGLRSADYRTVVAARTRRMESYSQQGFLLPAGAFTFFLIGMLGLRLGLFEDPRRHQRLIAGIMIFGAASWAVWEWLYPVQLAILPAWPLTLRALSNFVTTQPFAIGSLSADLALTYIGTILLLVAHRAVWLQRLGALRPACRE